MSLLWNGLLKIEEATLFSKDKKILWQEKNLKNIFHNEGQKLMLKCCFANSIDNDVERILPPKNYNFGLDNRAVLGAEDTVESIDGEPAKSTGYRRFAVKPDTFTLEQVSGIWTAKSPAASFKATSQFGPIKNFFLTATTQEVDELGDIVSINYLISSVAFSESVTVDAGSFFTVKMILSLQDIPV